MNEYSTLAKAAEEAFHNQYRGARVTYYLHYKFYHFEELQRECMRDGKTLAYYQQQGWEQMNDADRIYIKRHTTNGASTGRKQSVNKEASNLSTLKQNIEYDAIQIQRDFELNFKKIDKLGIDELKKELNKRGLSTTGQKSKLITDLLLHQQKEAHCKREQKEREDDPLQMNTFWRASIIVALFKKQARILHYDENEDESKE
jgi:hypothetical protein